MPVVSDPLGLISASGQVWTQNFGDGTLSRIDPVTSRATSHLQEVVGAASDGEDLWVAVDGNRLVRIDGATGQREASFRLGRTALFAPRDAGFLAVGHGSIWLHGSQAEIPGPRTRYGGSVPEPEPCGPR